MYSHKKKLEPHAEKYISLLTKFLAVNSKNYDECDTTKQKF